MSTQTVTPADLVVQAPAQPEAPPSPAGPAPDDGAPIVMPPAVRLPRALQTLRMSIRQIEFMFGARRRLGDVFRMDGIVNRDVLVVTCHPDHARASS